MVKAPLPVVILISGRGSNLKAIIEQTRSAELPIRICCVISNRPDAQGLELAAQSGIQTSVIDHTNYTDRDAFETELRRQIDHLKPGLVVLAGFMRVLSTGFVQHYEGKMINIHPSLLPAYPGLHTHQRAIDAGDQQHGATVHFVTPDVDAGPIIVQAQVPVLPDDTADSLAQRVLEQEHRIFPLAIKWFAENRLSLENGQVRLDGHPVAAPQAGTSQ